MEIIGKLLLKLPTQSGVGRNGNTWQKGEFVIETIEEQYPKKVCATLWGDKLDMLDKVNIGDTVKEDTLIAGVNLNTVLTAMNTLNGEIDALDKEIASAADDGIEGILTDHPLSEDLAEALAASKIPLVAIGNSDDRLFRRKASVAFLEVDNAEIGRLGASYLLSLGRYRTYGFVPDLTPTRWSRHRLRGFRSLLRENGHAVSVFSSSADEDSRLYHDNLVQWVNGLQKPAAVMLVGDYRAGDVFDACARLQLNIPEDVAILGVDNNPVLCDSLVPSLTSIEPAFEQEGFAAARTLDRLMKRRGKPTKPEIIRFPPIRVVERESTTPVPTSALLVQRALDFISANAHKGIGVKDVVEELGVSRRLADLRFHQYCGKSILETITDQRMSKVRRLLSTTRLSMGKIASTCGFNSPKHLSVAFRKKFNCSMSDYRNRRK